MANITLSGPPSSPAVSISVTQAGQDVLTSSAAPQAALVSGTNIKTINSSSILGSGDLVVAGVAAWGTITGLLAAQLDLQSALDGKQPSGTYATGTGTASGTNTGDVTTNAIGYASGAGGAVTQLTSKSTGVTINKICGAITMNGAALAAAATVSFVVTNNTVAARDVVIANLQSVFTAGSYELDVTAVAAGSFTLSLRNRSAGSLSQAGVINFAVIKAVNA